MDIKQLLNIRKLYIFGAIYALMVFLHLLSWPGWGVFIIRPLILTLVWSLVLLLLGFLMDRFFPELSMSGVNSQSAVKEDEDETAAQPDFSSFENKAPTGENSEDAGETALEDSNKGANLDISDAPSEDLFKTSEAIENIDLSGGSSGSTGGKKSMYSSNTGNYKFEQSPEVLAKGVRHIMKKDDV